MRRERGETFRIAESRPPSESELLEVRKYNR